MRTDVHRWGLMAALAALLALAGCGRATNDDASSAKPKVGPAASAGAGGAGAVALAPDDAEADKSFPLPEGVRGGANAPVPGAVPDAPRRSKKSQADSGVSPGAPTDAQIRRELREMNQVLKDSRRALNSPAAARAAIKGRGTALVPGGAPDVVGRVIAGGNAIARFPYIWGGGHGSFVDNGYDCSGSVSYALAAAGLLDAPLVSGRLAEWGEPGPGRWITIYANAGHVFMYVAGLRFDTSGRDGPLGSRWQTAPRSLAGFTVRHPPGL
ncbi:MAG: peptidoglycan DL-endopeptidase CwlO [Solirubrobacteraceae bacterium]|nr:peptidoglycan DL-endopeptidase CwlO [Solirubrobacteraceae bacterium]